MKHIVSVSELHAVNTVSLEREVLHCSLVTCVSTVFGGFSAQGIWLSANHIVDARSVEHSAAQEVGLTIDKLKSKSCSSLFLLGVFGGLPQDPLRGYNLSFTMEYLNTLGFIPYIDVQQTTALGFGFYFDIYSLWPGLISVSLWPCKDEQGNRQPAFELEPIFIRDLPRKSGPLLKNVRTEQ